MQSIIIDVTDPDDIISGYGAGALIRLERDTTVAMLTATELTTIAVISGTTEYEYWDTTAVPTTDYWYRTRFSKANASAPADYSAYTDLIQNSATTQTAQSADQARAASHVYASVAQLKDFIKDSGSAGSGGLGTTNDALFLLWLEDASRSIDGYCARTGAGRVASGFGPRIGTNRYDGQSGPELDLQDDLASLTSVTVKAAFGDTGTTYTDETDFLKSPYDTAPYRSLVLHGYGMPSWYGVRRGVTVVGAWGYPADLNVSTATLSEALDTTETSIDTTSSASFSPGQTMKVDSEQMFIRSIDDGDLIVDRGVNGTTAATHLTAAAISTYRYDARVKRTCLALALRRWKLRDSGSAGSFMAPSGGTLPSDPSEMAILRNGVGQLAIVRLS